MLIHTTLGTQRKVDEIYRPNSIDELHANFPKFKKRYSNITAYSVGNNWGYGCNAPSSQGGLLIDLSLCKKIKEFDPDHGLITLEPGVTYGDLARFLESHGNEWLAPVHGGGPDCSVMGNALERGYGITPIADHFGAVMCLKAILPSGKIYQGSLSKLGAPHLDRLFRYGIGPYYDGLFTQSGLGIVTEITLRLAKRPEYLEMFYFNLFEDADLELAVAAIKKSKRELGSMIGGINIINRERCLSMFADYPLDKIKSLSLLSETELKNLSQQFRVTPWLIIGMIYGPEKVAHSTRMALLENFKSLKMRKIFYNTKNRVFFQLLSKMTQKLGLTSIVNTLNKVEEAFQVLNGKPNHIALRLAYWKHENKNLISQKNLNPNRDQCGLIWYAPLVELKPSVVRKYVNFIKSASEKFGFNNLVTLTTVDDLCFDSTIPILFSQNSEADKKRAHDFYEYLLTQGLKQGFFPYRLNIDSQRQFDFQTELFGLDLINQARYR